MCLNLGHTKQAAFLVCLQCLLLQQQQQQQQQQKAQSQRVMPVGRPTEQVCACFSESFGRTSRF